MKLVEGWGWDHLHSSHVDKELPVDAGAIINSWELSYISCGTAFSVKQHVHERLFSSFLTRMEQNFDQFRRKRINPAASSQNDCCEEKKKCVEKMEWVLPSAFDIFKFSTTYSLKIIVHTFLNKKYRRWLSAVLLSLVQARTFHCWNSTKVQNAQKVEKSQVRLKFRISYIFLTPTSSL